MKYIFVAIMIIAAGAASAEQVRIPWKGDYAHNSDGTYSPENKYRSGWSKNFLNGTPQEGGKVERDGVLRAELIRQKASNAPLPFIILMHGCSGLTDVVERWAKEKAKIFIDHGYGVLILDSFTSRHVKETCGEPNYHWGVRRAEDAYSALQYLIDSKLADSDRVYVMGRSNGATAALMISTANMARGHRYRFAASFAVSPGCFGLAKYYTLVIPTLAFIGDKDQANDYLACEDLKDKGTFHLVVFKGVHHGYEDRTPAYVSHGWRMEHNAKADKETIDRVLAMMARPQEFKVGVEQR